VPRAYWQSGHPPVLGALFVAAAEPHVPSVQVAVVVALAVPPAGLQLSGLQLPAAEVPVALVEPAAGVALAAQSAVHAALPLFTPHDEESEGSEMPADRAIAGRAVPSTAPIASAVTKDAIVCLRFMEPPCEGWRPSLCVARERIGLV
jgi:hypothetical protein